MLTKEQFELVTLKSGQKSLRQCENFQTFHPGIGPVAEANILYVEQQRLVERCAKPGTFTIWDVGLGAAANAIAAIEALRDCAAGVEIHSFEKTLGPLHFALEHAEELGYLLPHTKTLTTLHVKSSVEVHPRLHWHLHLGDFREQMLLEKIPSPNSIFFDPYSPKVNRELWTLEAFTRLRERLDDSVPCLMTNYSRSTAARVTWLLAGFYVGVGSTIGEKEESTAVSNSLELLEQPLPKKWLERVKASQNAAPIQGEETSTRPISSHDFELLLKHPQFRA